MIDEKHKPLLSFLLHGLVAILSFVVLGGLVVYWVV
jgi:hypothetical protein